MVKVLSEEVELFLRDGLGAGEDEPLDVLIAGRVGKRPIVPNESTEIGGIGDELLDIHLPYTVADTGVQIVELEVIQEEVGSRTSVGSVEEDDSSDIGLGSLVVEEDLHLHVVSFLFRAEDVLGRRVELENARDFETSWLGVVWSLD